MKFLSPLICVFIFSLTTHAQSNSRTQWRITQPSWTRYHETEYGQFISKLGEAVANRKCNKVNTCMLSTANIYYGTDPAGLKYYSDCADLPYFLRAYFAWKNGLPFSIISEVKPSPRHRKKVKDVRYSEFGNIVSARFDILTKRSAFKSTPANAIQVLNETIPGLSFSAALRMSGAESDAQLFSDFYPVQINRNAIRPGTVIYDPNGHVAVVYKVSDDGRVFYIDAHPDNSLTMGMFTPKFARSTPEQGAGFKNFRPLRLVDARPDSTGSYAGGRIEGMPNNQLPDFGTEQFYGTHPSSSGWSRGKFILNGKQLNFYDFVRMSLTEGDAHIDPLRDMAQLTDDICVSLKDRVIAVDAAIATGIATKDHPPRLPYNIYGTEGEWESFSTPSRDARLKVSFMDLLDNTKANIESYKRRDPSIRYNGGNLARDLYNVYAQKAQECRFSYRTSNGRTVTLNLEMARQRLFDMSFDPYHCVELRWGAKDPQELSSCRDEYNKHEWYKREQWLRNQWERRYDARMDFSLYELTGPLPGAGIATPPDVDIVGYLRSLW